MIKAQNIVKIFDNTKKPVLKGIDLVINDGDFISMMGRSGSGKSTLLYLLSTLDRSFEGSVEYDGRDIKKMKEDEIHKIRNREIGFVFQFHYLINELTALENILLPARKVNEEASKTAFAKDLLAQVGLQDKADQFIGHLSGGEQQRVAIARSLIMKPKYIFADEPTGNLDSQSGDAVFDLFHRFNKEFNTTIIYVTHDQVFGGKAKRLIQMIDGIIES